ncbi:MAG: hypothetical protein PHO32_03190, partial [Candidatus Cloacimonetes bacterium]|nr:hypothetical protein [Candidatus Cloacimonadota bacterium]
MIFINKLQSLAKGFSNTLNLKKCLFCIAALAAFSYGFSVPFMEGEKLSFDVKYGMINAAEATLEARSSVYQGSP